MSTDLEREGDSGGAPSTVDAVHSCNAKCFAYTVSAVRAQLGLDPDDASGLQPRQIDEIAGLAHEVAGSNGNVIAGVPATDLVDDRSNQRGISGFIEDAGGHLHIVLGTIAVGDQTFAQLAHGTAGVALVSEADLASERFLNAWKVQSNNDGVRLKVGAATLLASEITHNFGEIRPYETVAHSFRFTNVGPTPLIFGKPSASCSCTSLSVIENTVLKSGQSTTLTARLASTNTPSLQQFVSLDVVEPEGNVSRKLRLLLVASQRVFKFVSPRELDFAVVRPTHTYSRSITVTETTVDRYTITGVETGALPIMKWTKDQISTGGGARTYKVTFQLRTTDQQPGRHRGLIKLLTNSAVSPEIPVPVRFEVAPMISSTPGSVALGEASIGTPRRQVIRLKSADGTPIRVRLTSVPPEATVDVKTGPDHV